MRCDEVAAVLPGLVDDDATDLEVRRHVEQCLRCQAEVARYRKLVRTLELLRARYVEPTPGLLGETLAAITEAAERGALRTYVTTRRLAYGGAAVGTALAAGAAAALIIARSRRRAVA
ncbi:MAG: hypothetical protein KatS3mg009_0186 [Acidimicrobiia bacterium]|nr:MAG: hypothetical protein KatS3mg009_0186 [Acidimicrobiia bacterium]